MDIDIDLKTDFDPKKVFPEVTNASMVENGELKKHLVGVYFQNIPVDPVTELAAIPYDRAEDFGFMKIDFLHLSVLDIFESKQEIRTLLKKAPDWSMLENREIVEKLFHISKHFDVIDRIKPTSVEELADVLALIRPGKTKLIHKYKTNKQEVRKELYTKRQNSDLRKAHAVPYALLIVLQMHLIKAGIL
jgi:hypothetical protein